MDKQPASNTWSIGPHDDEQHSNDNRETGIDAAIPNRFRGTVADQHDMHVLGKKQVLRRNFKPFTTVAFGNTVMVAWEFLPIIAVYALQDGGPPIIFWGLIAGCIGMSLVYASLAEMASMCPTSGGQYHWCSEFAPPSIQKELSYAVGWLTAMGWQVYLAGVCFAAGSIIQGLIVLNNLDSYVYHAWHGTMLAIAVVAFILVVNVFFGARLPPIESGFLFLHVAGLIAIVVPLWVMAPHGNAHDTLLRFSSTANWGNLGLASMIGMVNPVGQLCGYDCCVHMAEEVQDASIVIPKALIWSVVPNGIMALIMGSAFVFSIGDLDSVLATPTYEPFLQVFYNATQSKAGATVMASIIVIMLAGAGISEVATASRQLWSFARDRGVPFSGWLSRVSPTRNIPLNAIYVTVTISALLSLINIGSYTALNAINSLGVVSLMFSYTVTIGCVILRRLRGPPLPKRRWSLGRYGLAVNIASLLFITPVLFFAFWPVARPVTAAGFNWSSVMFVGVLTIALANYIFSARHQYTGPVVLVKRED